MADAIFRGGTILTVCDSYPEVEALAVKDGKILQLGSEDVVRKLQTPATEVIDLAGKTLMPGLIEPHTHPIWSSLVYHHYIDITGYEPTTKEQVWEELATAAKNAPRGQWISAMGYNPMLVPGIEAPTRQLLDQISPHNPMVLYAQNSHAIYVNSRALEIAGVTTNTPDPRGGWIVRDETGQPTGMFQEQSAMNLIAKCVPRPAEELGREFMKRQLDSYAMHGYTTVAALGLIPVYKNSIPALEEIVRSHESPVRMAVYHFVKNAQQGNFVLGAPGKDNFCLTGIKWVGDGSPYAGTMASAEPYLDTDLTRNGLGFPSAPCRGVLIYKDEDLYQSMLPYHQTGHWQLAVHAHGERAIAQVLAVYERLLTDNPRQDHRYRLEHCGLITKDQLLKAHSLGVTVSFFPDHVHFFGRHLRDDILGPERAERFMPLKTALDIGHRITVHSDSPCCPIDPFRVMQTVTTRRVRQEAGRDDVIIGAKEAVGIDDVIKAYTINAAWQIFHEDVIGSLEPGKLADFTLVSEDPRKVDPSELDIIKICKTYRSGRPVKLKSTKL